nr:retrovirus-related Pol polyprotein from transposon TNT 1-94 [Tanacetum cinerariifolium]
MKVKLAVLEASPLSSQNPKNFQQRNKVLVAKTFDWDEEEVSDEEEVTQVKLLMALVDDEHTVGKNHARNGKWIDITMRNVNTLLSMDEDSDWQNYLKFINIDLKGENYKAQPYQYASSSKQILKAKAKPFPPCTHCGINDHIPDDCKNYPECENVEAMITPPQDTIMLFRLEDERNDIYVLDMSSLSPNGACFFAKALESVNWLWHKRLSLLNFKNINKLAKQNKVLGLPSLVYSKDKPCTSCEKKKHHRTVFKTKQNFSIRKCLHLLHMDLFRPEEESSTLNDYVFHQNENHIPKVIAPNELEIPHTEDTEVPPDLINTKGTHEKNFQNDQMITQPTDASSGNNTKGSRSITKPLVPDVTQSHISNQASSSSYFIPQDRWSRDQHIKLVNIIGDPGKGMLTRSMAAKLTAASASKCLFADFLSKIEPKKVSEDDKGILICQEQYTMNPLKKYEISDSSSVKTPMVPLKNLGFNLKGYSDSDYASFNMDRKSTLGTCQILGGKLVCWSAKKQQSVAMSLVEAAYVVVAGCCASILGMKSQLSDYDIHYNMNFLREFWSTVVAFNPFPSTDEPEKRLLKEFLIKFSVLNGKRPLTLDFNTFCSSTGLDYNNGKYVDHPTPEDKNFRFLPLILSNSNFKKDISKVIDIELTAHMIAVNNQKDSVSLPPLAAKPKKGKSQTVTSNLPKSQGPEASVALSKKSKNPKSKKTPAKTKRDIQLASTGLPTTLNEGTRKSKPLPESIATHLKDSGRNKQPLNMDITSSTLNKGTAKTTPRPEGSLGDKDLGRNIPPADMEPIHTPVVDLSGTGVKYQVDETQSIRLRYWPLTKNKGKTSSEDELEKESVEEEVLAAEDDMDEDPQDDAEVRTPSLNQTQPEPSNVQESASVSSSPDLKRFDNTQAAVSYTDLKASIKEYYEENIAHRDQTGQLVVASMSSLDKSNFSINDLYKGLIVMTEHLKDINNSTMKDLQAHALKQEEALAALTKSSTNMAWNLGSRMTAVEISQTALEREVSSLRRDTSEIKYMMAEIYQAFKGQSSLAPSGSVTLTLALTHIPANVERENATNTATEEPPSHIEGETEDQKIAIPISSIQPTEEKMKKSDEEAKLFVMSKPEVIKVVREEAKKLRINPKKVISTKAGEKFKKARDAEHEVLKREHAKKGRNRKHMKPEPEIKVHGLECNRSLSKAFQRWDDIHKVGVDSLVSYLVMASIVKTKENARFSLKLRKLINDHPYKEMPKSKKVKLEALGYHVE